MLIYSFPSFATDLYFMLFLLLTCYLLSTVEGKGKRNYEFLKNYVGKDYSAPGTRIRESDKDNLKIINALRNKRENELKDVFKRFYVVLRSIPSRMLSSLTYIKTT
jgi:hypothetical protein